MKKIVSIVLSVCMVVMMSVPAFAYSSSDAMKVQLSDQAMAEALGGGGALYSTITSEDGGNFSGTMTTTDTGCDANYTITGNIDFDGNGGVVLESGVLPRNTSQSFTVAAPSGHYARVDLATQCYPGTEPAQKASATALMPF